MDVLPMRAAVFFGIIIMFLSFSTIASIISPLAEATGVSVCQSLSAGNYVLTQNVSSKATCFTIGANGIVLDGNGYWINYSNSSAGYAINNSLGYDNITIKNLNIVQGSATPQYSSAIYASGMYNGTISNNNITTRGYYDHGVYLNDSNTNDISGNSITTSGANGYGIVFDYSTSNNISDNEITTSNSYGYGIYLWRSDTNTVSGNTISTSGFSADSVILEYGNSNTVSGNSITAGIGDFIAGIDLAIQSSTNTISNNIITASGNYGVGLMLRSSSNSNTLPNNTVATSGANGYGTYIDSSISNNVTGGSIYSGLSYSYFLANLSGTNFTDTNFTAQREIYFNDTGSRFNYNNQTNGNIWLATNVSAQSYINRTLITWSQSKMKWNDTDSVAGTAARYNIIGLLANTQYNIFNTSGGVQTNPYALTSDSAGAVSFEIGLNGETEILVTSSTSILEVSLAEPPSSSITDVIRNATFIVNATVFCRTGNCGNVFGTVRYNASSSDPNTAVSTAEGATPFYINGTPAYSTKACPGNPLAQDESCNITWTINSTGSLSSMWKLGVLFNSSYLSVAQNHTDNATVKIVDCLVDTTVHFGSISFDNAEFPRYNASGNAGSLYNISVNSGSCNTDLYIKSTDLTNTSMGYTIGVSNMTFSNTTGLYADSFNLSSSYQVLKLNIAPPANVTAYYWLNVQPVLAGIYTGTVTIGGVRNGESI